MADASRVVLQNPGILTWAREELRLSVPTVALHLKKEESEIKGWEDGTILPTFPQLEEIAKYYGRPSASFFLPVTPPHSEKPRDFRTLPDEQIGLFGRETLLAYREVRNMLQDAREIIDALNLNLKYSLPSWNLQTDVEHIALDLRQLLGISVERQIKEQSTHLIALEAWRNVLFDRGIVVRICVMPIQDARAFCIQAFQLGGIGLSNEDREHGKIFSLFHEVCHLGLGKVGISGVSSNLKSSNGAIEQYCDRFAASFLLPKSHHEVTTGLRQFSDSPDIDTARNLADKFKVSKYVVARRALDLEMITETLYWKVVETFHAYDSGLNKKEKSGGNYNATQVNRMGKRFVVLVLDALKKDYLSPIEAQNMLGIKADTIISML